jgi:hypothetical protein
VVLCSFWSSDYPADNLSVSVVHIDIVRVFSAQIRNDIERHHFRVEFFFGYSQVYLLSSSFGPPVQPPAVGSLILA